DMLAAWVDVFNPVPKTVPNDADERAAQAEPSTPLATAGLSARALSALEPYGVATVADLVAVDPVRLNRLSGVAEATRRAVKTRARQWGDKFGTAVTGRGQKPQVAAGTDAETLPDPFSAAELLVAHAGTTKAESRRIMARLLLGLEPGLDPFASQLELADSLGVTRGRIAQQTGALQESWAKRQECRDLLDAIAATARQSLADL